MPRSILPTSLAAAALVWLGCQTAQSFECSSDNECVASGADGVCEPNGFCSFPDMRCPSQRAYGDFAGNGLAGMCVEDVEATSGDVSTTSTTTDPQTGSTTTPLTTTSGSSSTTQPPATSSSSTGDTVDPSSDSSSTSPESCGRWWDAQWPYRLTVSYPAGSTTEALTGFPLLISLDPTRIDYRHARPGGEDLRIVLPGAGEPLAYERHVWRAEGDDQSSIWVRTPQLAPEGGEFHVYYGSPNARDVSSPWPVYAERYSGVSHNDATKLLLQPGEEVLCTGETLQEPGVVGEVNSDGVFCINVQVAMPLQQSGTASMWVRRDNVFANDQSLVQNGQRIATKMFSTPVLWNLVLASGATPRVSLRSDGATGLEEWGAILPNWQALDWHHIAATNNAGEITIYFDGVAQSTTELSDGGQLPSATGTGLFYLGQGQMDVAGPLEGAVDEFRYTEMSRSAQWIAAEFASDTDALLTYSAEEELSDCHVID